MREEKVCLSIRLLGPYRVTLDGQPVTSFVSDKSRALLAYLAVEAGRPHTRGRLAGLLWPDYPERNARTSLRTALKDVRKVIGDHAATPPFLETSPQTVQFNLTSDVWLDVDVFDKLLPDPNASQPAEQPSVQDLQSAIDLYQGEFLEGFSLSDCADFEGWVLIRRERMRRKVLEALHRLAECHEQHGDYDLALQCARRQLDLDPWQERAHRQVMRLYAFRGERAVALAQYLDCREMLNREFGVEPDDQTTALYNRIRTGELKPPRSSDLPPPPEVPVSEPSDTSYSGTAGQRRQRFTGKKLIAVIAIAALCLMAGLIAWLVLRPPRPLKPPLAVIAGTEAKVKVERASTGQEVMASFGMPLFRDDVVHTFDRATATIICDGGLTLILAERKTLVVDCVQIVDPQIRVVWLDPSQLDQPGLVPTPIGGGLTLDETRASRGEQGSIPLLLSPRNTVITDTRPSFHWQPVAGASRYRLSISMPTEEDWHAETHAESLPYPAAEPPLRPGSMANIVTVQTERGGDSWDTGDVTHLDVMDERNAQNLAAAERAIRDLDLEDAAKSYLLVQLYQGQKMWASAIRRLEWLIDEQGITSSYAFQLVGDLYSKVELYALAEEHYRAALATAEANDDKIAQAAAYHGLAHTYYAFGEIEQTLSYLKRAEGLYRRTGQAEQVETVHTERISVENSTSQP